MTITQVKINHRGGCPLRQIMGVTIQCEINDLYYHTDKTVYCFHKMMNHIEILANSHWVKVCHMLNTGPPSGHMS